MSDQSSDTEILTNGELNTTPSLGLANIRSPPVTQEPRYDRESENEIPLPNGNGHVPHHYDGLCSIFSCDQRDDRLRGISNGTSHRYEQTGATKDIVNNSMCGHYVEQTPAIT